MLSCAALTRRDPEGHGGCWIPSCKCVWMGHPLRMGVYSWENLCKFIYDYIYIYYIYNIIQIVYGISIYLVFVYYTWYILLSEFRIHHLCIAPGPATSSASCWRTQRFEAFEKGGVSICWITRGHCSFFFLILKVTNESKKVSQTMWDT